MTAFSLPAQSPGGRCCHLRQFDIIDIWFDGVMSMAVVTVRNLPDETHRALKLRAAQNGRSTEAEIREILEEQVRPKARLKVGSELAAFAKRFKGLDFNLTRDQTPADPAEFG
jgi:antitoxin FitA